MALALMSSTNISARVTGMGGQLMCFSPLCCCYWVVGGGGIVIIALVVGITVILVSSIIVPIIGITIIIALIPLLWLWIILGRILMILLCCHGPLLSLSGRPVDGANMVHYSSDTFNYLCFLAFLSYNQEFFLEKQLRNTLHSL